MSKHKSHEGKNIPPGIYDREINIRGTLLDGAKARDFYDELFFTYGGVAACNMDKKGKLLVVLTGASEIHEVLGDNETFSKGDLAIKSGQPIIGKVNLFTAGYRLWRILRKAAAPLAYRSKMPLYWKKMWDGFENVYNRWESEGIVDLSTESAIAMFEVGGLLFFSKKFTPKQSAVIPNAISYLHILQAKVPLRDMMGPIVGPLMYYGLFRSEAFKGDAAVANKDEFVDAIIKERQAELAQKQEFTDIMQIIIDSVAYPEVQAAIAEGEIPSTFLRDQVSTFGVGFGETTATTLAHSITTLLTHPAGQKVVEEITRVIGRGVPTYEQLSELVYSKRFVKEVWRTGPPSFQFFRTNEGQWAKIGEYDIPPDSSIVINVYGLHHREDYYPHPYEFEPDRYEPGHPYHVEVEGTVDATFGDGPRICWGNEHAIMLELASLILFVQRYLMGNGSTSVAFVNEPMLDEYGVPVPDFKLTLRPQPGLVLEFKRD